MKDHQQLLLFCSFILAQIGCMEINDGSSTKFFLSALICIIFIAISGFIRMFRE